MKWLRRILLILAVLFVVAQFIRPLPANIQTDPRKTLAKARNIPPDVAAVFNRACRDCHSNTTAWPWYSQIAPVSWMLAEHVKDGRKELNIDEWGAYTPRREARKLEEICDQVKKGDMPLPSYLWIHHDSRLSDADKQLLCNWSGAERAKVIAAHPDAAKRAPRPRG